MGKLDEKDLIEEDRCLAFLDVLGFKEVLSSGKNKVLEYLNAIEIARGGSPFEVESFILGDAIVLSKPMSKVGNVLENLNVIADVLQAVGHIQWRLAVLDVWVRGAVTIDSAYRVGQSFISGSALARAADLERTAALYPRVILDNRIIGSPYLAYGEAAARVEGSYLKTPGQLVEQINLISSKAEWGKNILFNWDAFNPANLGTPKLTPHLKKDVPLFVDYLVHSKDLGRSPERGIILENLARRACSDINHYAKYRWVCDYMTAHLLGNDLLFKDDVARLTQL